MKFLVILICLMVNYLWLKDVDRFDDGWFFRFRCRIDEWSGAPASNSSLAWLVPVALVYSIPLLTLAILLGLVGNSLLGLAAMLVHILVLLVALDRTQPGQQAKDFLSVWKTGDMAACLEFLRDRYGPLTQESLNTPEEICSYFSKRLTYGSFERMFVMFFWYMCTGPLGVLFAYISYQMRDSHAEDQPDQRVVFIALLIQFLEWIPLRILAITFSLAGNFVLCFDTLRDSFWRFGSDVDNAQLLYGFARSATSGMVVAASSDEDEAFGEEDAEAAEIKSMLGLLERSQAIWLSVLALITIVGL